MVLPLFFYMVVLYMKRNILPCPFCGGDRVKLSDCTKVIICKQCRHRHQATQDQIIQYGGDQIKAVIETWNLINRK